MNLRLTLTRRAAPLPLQISRLEALGKPAIDRREQIAGLGAAPLVGRSGRGSRRHAIPKTTADAGRVFGTWQMGPGSRI